MRECWSSERAKAIESFGAFSISLFWHLGLSFWLGVAWRQATRG